jgi:hypothetical protein
MFSRLPPVHGDGADGLERSTDGPALIHEAGPAQPCPAHRYACTVYRDRPGACHHYECALLRRHRAGEVDEGEARAIVARARTLGQRARTDIEAVVGSQAGAALSDLAARFSAVFHHDEHPILAHPAQAEAHARLAALDEILRQHFRHGGGDPAEPAPA